jgi:hypothetical protein
LTQIHTYTAPDLAQIEGFGLEETEAFVQARRAHGLNVDRGWGLMYQSTADSIMLDNRPDYGRFFYEGLRTFRTRLELTETETNNPVQLTITSFQHLPMYILYGWETGIYNEFRHLQSRGLSKAQLMELVMFAQLQACAGCSSCTTRSAGICRPGRMAGEGATARRLGTDPDIPAAPSLSVRELTPGRSKRAHSLVRADDWLCPEFGQVRDHLRRFCKWHRARWVIFQKLPKQTAPCVMIPLAPARGNRERCAKLVLLGKAWRHHP